jgi:hypothetical protein
MIYETPGQKYGEQLGRGIGTLLAVCYRLIVMTAAGRYLGWW